MPFTVIARIGYDPGTRTLPVWLRPSGRRYDDLDVPLAEYGALHRAFSKGRGFTARYDSAGGLSPTSPTVAELYHATVTRG